jgi:hypothetical protein
MSEVEVPHHVQKEDHKRVGVFIAVLAVIMALISSMGKNQANQMIVKEVEASNEFAWYQAKRQRSYLNEIELQRIDFELAGNPGEGQQSILKQTRNRLKAQTAKYEAEGEEIQAKAKANNEAAELAKHRHHWIELGEICVHIAVVLCSLTLLTDSKLFFRLGIVATLAGMLLASGAFFVHSHSAPGPEKSSMPKSSLHSP